MEMNRLKKKSGMKSNLLMDSPQLVYTNEQSPAVFFPNEKKNKIIRKIIRLPKKFMTLDARRRLKKEIIS